MKYTTEEPRSSLGRAWKHMSWLYYQYLLVTALYMLEPWERTVFIISFKVPAPGACVAKLSRYHASEIYYVNQSYVVWINFCPYSMLVSIVGMALYTGYIFMPQHILAILHYFEIVQ